jgi:DNA repair exonuclease SbcCD ATPase subunit
MKKEIKIGDLYKIYQKYGDLGFKIRTPYGYKNIEWCGITEKNADVYRCELQNGMFIEGADYHKLKKDNEEFVVLKELQIGDKIQTRNGLSSVKNVCLLDEKDTLYDVQVAEVHQYYSNGIVSHNTVLTVDLLLFLFFNETTKTTKAEEIFNRFTNKDHVHVEGNILIDGDEYIIIRNITRKKSKSGDWNVKTELDFFKKLSDGSLQNFTGEQRQETERFIKNSIGTKEDFLMTILTTSTNLEELIDSKPTARGQVLSRFMGLDFLKRKEEIAKGIYSDFSKSMLSNVYNSEKLKTEIQNHQTKITDFRLETVETEKNLIEVLDKIKIGQDYRDKLLKNKHVIDNEISLISPNKVQEEINKLEFDRTKVESQLSEINVKEPSEYYHEDLHDKIKKEISEIEKDLIRFDTQISDIERLKSSIEGGIKCEHCGIELINAAITNAKIAELDGLIVHKEEKNNLLHDLNGKETSFVKLKKEFDEYEKNKLIKEKYEVSIESINLKIEGLKLKLERYNEVQNKILENKKTDELIIKAGLRLDELEIDKNLKQRTIDNLQFQITTMTNKIEENEKIIIKISEESEKEKIYVVYLDIFGKNGISKMIMKTMTPLINSELQRLLEDSSHFRLEIRINEKNEVEFIMVDNNTQIEKLMSSGSGYERTIASLALRAVLSKVCSLPKPNIIVFDEVFGKISNDNLDMVSEFFIKIKDYFEKIFLITHNPLVNNWADNIIKIKKEENVSLLVN